MNGGNGAQSRGSRCKKNRIKRADWEEPGLHHQDHATPQPNQTEGNHAKTQATPKPKPSAVVPI